MIEVFKTNVSRIHEATEILASIRDAFPNYKVNFDLEDCDKILRVESRNGPVQSSRLINLLKDHGFHAEILQDINAPVASLK